MFFGDQAARGVEECAMTSNCYNSTSAQWAASLRHTSLNKPNRAVGQIVTMEGSRASEAVYDSLHNQ